jgi:AcrR family transcriptional regulator
MDPDTYTSEGSALETRRRLHSAAVRLIAGGEAASVRAITREAGITEGALYRHYKGRSELTAAVFRELVAPMIAEKEALVAMRAPVRDRIREWVRCTYARFDRDPDGFAYVFLSDEAVDGVDAVTVGRQGALFGELIEQGQREGALREMDRALATALFVGLLLAAPTRIRSGALAGPASVHVDAVADAAWRVLAMGDESE